MNQWEHNNPVKIIFGTGCRAKLLDILDGSKNFLIVTSKRGKKFISEDPILKVISNNKYYFDGVESNPSLESLTSFIQAENKKYDAIVAFGGGSTIDTAKAISYLYGLNNTNEIYDIFKNPIQDFKNDYTPIYAIPTTSGTGSEVTSFATIWDKKNKKKLSLNSQYLFPTLAFVDPEVTFGLPYNITISTGLDALNQAFESLWNKNRTPFTTFAASKAIGNALESLPRLSKDINDKEARSLMAESSLLSGIAISQTFTAICHSISYPLTAHFDIPHGLACAFSMGSVLRIVINNCPDCLTEVVTQNKLGSYEFLSQKISDLLIDLKVKNLVRNKLKNESNLFKLRDKMLTPGRSDNFVLTLNDSLLLKILSESFT